MELSLDDLLSGLQEAQEQKSKVIRPPPLPPPTPCDVLLPSTPTLPCCSAQTKLSERNVVELVNKLKNLGLLGDDLLYTTNGKEYVTTQRVQAEVRAAVRAAGGRVPLVCEGWGGVEARWLL